MIHFTEEIFYKEVYCVDVNIYTTESREERTATNVSSYYCSNYADDKYRVRYLTIISYDC